ncbi:oligopeptide transporter [Amylocystis lapponica]|nr:oligopeptide transporter [Amylocystis lapponica]
MEVDLDELEEEDSPYPEVRASVSNIDDPDMPALTLRMWFLGLLLLSVGGSANLFFFMRQPAPTITPSLVLLISHPLGKFLAYALPITTYQLPRLLGGTEFSLNPGPWNIKEHALIYMMANVALGTPYAIQATITANADYSYKLGYWFNVVLVLSTQLTGFGLAGLCRRFLVWPASMIWPQNLVTCTFMNTLHAEEDADRGGISRYKYFTYVGAGAFVFFWLPGYLFTALSAFSWVCWIVPNNVVVNQLFGVTSGLGLSFVTFDWTEISWLGSPLMTPWWAQVQLFGGFVLFYWIIGPVLYYTNVWNLAYFPMLTQSLFDRHGKQYNISRVVDEEHRFDQVAYDSYSPLFMPLSYAMSYLITFALSSCVFVHTLLYHGNTLLMGLKHKVVEKDDIHAKLMRAYPEVPDWWYGTVFAVCFSLAIVANEVWHTGVPVWSLLLAVLLPVAYIVPSGFLFAMAGQGISMNLLAQIVPGMLLPGQPVANMMFKAFSLQSLSEGSRFVQDLKLAHYVKVPPRAAFIAQLVATLVVPFIQLGVQQWMFHAIPDICTPGQKDLLTCPYSNVFYSASVLWGLIGPARQFGINSIYHPQLYAIIVGAFLPIPLWLWQRRFPNSWNRFINAPLILTSVLAIPPATGMNYSSWFVFGFIFQYLIRRRNFTWWSKFNYVTSAALDTGTVISVLFIFFTLGIPKNGINLRWWGNTVWENTADYLNLPLRRAPPGGIP